MMPPGRRRGRRKCCRKNRNTSAFSVPSKHRAVLRPSIQSRAHGANPCAPRGRFGAIGPLPFGRAAIKGTQIHAGPHLVYRNEASDREGGKPFHIGGSFRLDTLAVALGIGEGLFLRVIPSRFNARSRVDLLTPWANLPRYR